MPVGLAFDDELVRGGGEPAGGGLSEQRVGSRLSCLGSDGISARYRATAAWFCSPQPADGWGSHGCHDVLLSPVSGVGVTASKITCTIGAGGVSTEDLTPWLVVSADGGRTWRVAGAQLPRWLSPGFSEARLAFSTEGTGWLAASGALAYTSDGGRRWHQVNLDGQIAELVSGGSYVAVLVARHDSAPLAWRLAPGSARHWPLPPVPGPLTLPAASLAIQSLAVMAPSGQLVLDVPGTSIDRLIAIGPADRGWVSRTEPCHQAQLPDDPLSGFQALVAAPGGDLGAVCGHGVGMMHATQSFLVSRDGGRTWRLRSAAVAFQPDPSGMPFGGPTGVACPARSVCYLATAAEVKTSTNGGVRWRSVGPPAVPGNSAFGAVFSFLGWQNGWLLLPGEALLRTTNGMRWVALGRLST